jgi:transcriptional regulator with XRE-family HTH domain
MIQDRRKRDRRNRSLVALRKIIHRTQAQFAALVGVSTDTVVSWENGRNRLTAEKARAIHVATGARTPELLKGQGKVKNMDRLPYSLADFDAWHRTYLGSTDESRADYFSQQAYIHVWLLFHAAAKPGAGKLKQRLPAVWISFLEWADQIAENCQLKRQIKEVQSKHKRWLKHQSAKAHAMLDHKKGLFRELR